MREQKSRGVGFEQMGRFLDGELQRLMDFVNDRVVPGTCPNCEGLLRRAAEEFQRAADRLAAQKEKKTRPKPGASTRRPRGSA